MSLYGNPFGSTLDGLQIVETETVGDPWQDWSGCRSRSRAERRLKQGHPQRIVTRYRANGKCLQAGNKIYMHPHDRLRLERGLENRE